MNDDLERRLRRYGATVDRTADAAQLRRDAAADLENVVALSPPRRPYRVIATVAASAAVLVGVIVFAARGGSEGDRADPSASGDRPAFVDSTEPASSTDAPPTSTDRPASVTVTSAAETSTSVATTSTSVATTRAPQTTRAPVCPTYRANSTLPLRLCDQSEAVRQVQITLGVNADGYFGPATETAVERFQRDHGLAVDGLVGEATWAALFPPNAPTTTVR